MKHPETAKEPSTPPSETRSRRMSLPILPSHQLPALNDDGSRGRTQSMESSWLKKFVRRPSMDISEEIENLSLSGSYESIDRLSDDNSQPAIKVTEAPTNASSGGMVGTKTLKPPQPAMSRRKSDSMLWKWFNSPMQAENSIKGQKITEIDESTVSSGTSPLTNISQQMAHQADTDNLVGMDSRKFGALKFVRNMSARDLNAVSPSQW